LFYFKGYDISVKVVAPAFQRLIYLYVFQLKNRLNTDVDNLAMYAKVFAKPFALAFALPCICPGTAYPGCHTRERHTTRIPGFILQIFSGGIGVETQRTALMRAASSQPVDCLRENDMTLQRL
jgi:hypothetical protein